MRLGDARKKIGIFLPSLSLLMALHVPAQDMQHLQHHKLQVPGPSHGKLWPFLVERTYFFFSAPGISLLSFASAGLLPL
jgi:hypothetical protein